MRTNIWRWGLTVFFGFGEGFGGLVGWRHAERRPRASRVVLQAREQFQNNRKNPAPPPLPRDWIFAHDATVDTVPAG